MPKFNVGELKAALDDFGDHLPVVLSIGMEESEEFTLEAGSDAAGETSVILDSPGPHPSWSRRPSAKR